MGRPRVPRAVIGAGLVLLPVAWIVPGLLGGGGALSASDAARGTPSQGSAALADVPALAVLDDAVELLTWPVAVALVPAVVLLRGSARVLAAMALAWVLIVAAMSQAGYAGNPRYLVAAAAVACALAAAGAVRAAGWPGAVVLVAAVAVVTAGDLADQVDELGVRARARTGLPRAIERAGGADALERCAAVRTAPRPAPTSPGSSTCRSRGSPTARSRPWSSSAPAHRAAAPPYRRSRAAPGCARPPARPTGRSGPPAARSGEDAATRSRRRPRWRPPVGRARYRAFWKRTVTRSKPRPRSSPSSIWRVLRSAARRSAGSAAAAACSLRWAAR